MLDQRTRTTILTLHQTGMSTRAIARTLSVSRNAVKKIIENGSPEPPTIARTSKADSFRDEITTQYRRCKGNLVRVHEELVAKGADLSYQALTAFCRRERIGYTPPLPAGTYQFAPGQEMQHDTSPHDVRIGGRIRRVQTASLVLCHSRMLFFQHYPRFDRFTCKMFLVDALRYFGGVAADCMIDNTNVVVASGTGRNMIPAPEMVAFSERFGFQWKAHEKGDANRSGRVERPFHYIENNFLAGRDFMDWRDCNAAAVSWCDRVNATHRRHLHASPRDLFAAEVNRLKPLPPWIPDVYALHHRIVDVEGFVNVHQNRYSVPWKLIGHRVEVRESKECIEIFHGPRLVASHTRIIDPCNARTTNPAHRPPRGQGRAARGDVSVEEERLLHIAPELADYLTQLKKQSRSRGLRDVRRLLRLAVDYPRGPLLETLRVATHYGLYDLERVERMLLRSLTHGYFFIVPDADPASGEDRNNCTREDMDDG